MFRRTWVLAETSALSLLKHNLKVLHYLALTTCQKAGGAVVLELQRDLDLAGGWFGHEFAMGDQETVLFDVQQVMEHAAQRASINSSSRSLCGPMPGGNSKSSSMGSPEFSDPSFTPV